MNYKRLLFLWLVIVMFSGGVWGQEYSRSFVKEYKVSGKSTVEVYNKYGKVHVVTWNKDSVRFEVELRVSATDQKKLDKLKSNIDFDFVSTNYYVIARTEFTKSGGIFSDMVETIIPSNNVSIDYVVYLPSNTNLKLENKFGDIYVDDFNGNLDLFLSNGALKANKLVGNINIQLNSADAMVNEVKSGVINLRYSDIEIRHANKLDFDTKFSKVNVDNAKQLKINSRRDSYQIREVGILSGKGDFTKMNIERLTSNLNFSNKYYSLTVEEINPKFNIINISSELTDVELYFTRETSYSLDITHHPDVFLSYPKEKSKLETKELNDEDKLLLTYGTIGNSKQPNLPKVKIFANKKCFINLRQR